MIAPGIFRQYDIRGIYNRDLTVEAAEAIGRAYPVILAEHGLSGAVAVGRDNRPSGAALRDALVRGLLASGADVIDVGEVPTPLLYWSLHHLPVVGGIQITGSHNPPEYNGFKCCVGTGSLHGEGIQRLRAIIDGGRFPSGDATVRSADVIGDYVADMVSRIGPIPASLKVVIDCGNGAGAIVAPRLFRALGASVTWLYEISDGTFPNHHPDPTVEANLVDLQRSVRETGSALGIGFDGDADRIGLVDEEGTVVWGDHLLLLYARDVLARTGPGQPIIFDVKCSQTLADGITAAGGTPMMWKTGHSLIKDKMKALGAPLAGEMSGHMFFAEGFYGHDDALYAAARLLRIVADAGRSVKSLLADVPHLVSTPELRVDCPDDRKEGVVRESLAHFAARYPVSDVDGVRILFPDGAWGLIRSSNTQPILVMRFEAASAARLAEIRGEVESFLVGRGIDVTPGTGH
ncbi:MAG: phosphomannomutase/phosphoglucomutase [Gemmatimonadota bacterium]|nr:phosphomannomutase/phosphoglucomutase [Gemmatimonadota bacterium]MDQ8146501.1 phosphomannomutase/phosphoglucomutase [Gemmatimonadota bacterium]MDQ8148428.1 phosphomannomutase/phosphoglucomutase [Gemmatimonadota bacterium]MDQ8157151.1 phosphomannomutase/phosphoglucomutase [Gemmatimonadota bacterium]MDQ8176219.1 phosphomannomutase/phosphoglucomutase [Gemmatimonadota bacterium]